MFVRVLFLVPLVLACGDEPNIQHTPTRSTQTPTSLEKTEWIAETIDNRPLVAGTNITMNFAADGLGGYDGCNWYGARMTLSGRLMKIARAESTARGCLKAGVEEQSSAFHAALEKVARYRATPQRLELLDAGGAPLLTFRGRPRYAMNPADLIGTRWALVGNPKITLAFGEGTTSGFGGCRNYTGTYTARDDHISFTSIAMKEMECDRGLAIQRDEEDLTTVLSEATHYRLHDGRLTISTDTGKTLELVRRE